MAFLPALVIARLETSRPEPRKSDQVPPERYFFLSYARENRKNADRERPDGSQFNLIDQFFERLCQYLSDSTGVNSETVGYRDISGLDVSAPWRQELVQAMQAATTLVALISPHYLRSLNCGREFDVFLKRYELYRVQIKSAIASPIIPVLWTNIDDCWPYATQKARDFLRDFQLTGQGLPDDYPALGMCGQCEFARPQTFSQACRSLANRIKQLAEREPALPRLEGVNDFHKLPSAFDLEQTHDKPVLPMPAPVFDLANMPPPAGAVGGPAPPGLHLVS